MASKTYQALYTDALRQADELTGSGSNTAKIIIKSGINEAYSEAAGIRDWKTLEGSTTIVTAAGTNEYTPITASASTPRIRRIESVIDQTANRYLDEVKREDFETSYPYVDTSSSANQGAPLIWYQSGYSANRDIKISFYPVPDSARTLKVVYYQEPIELVNDTDVPLIPDEYHYGLTYYALAKYYEFQQEPVANFYLKKHEEWKAKMLAAEYGNSDEMPAMQPEVGNRTFVIGKIGRIYNR